MEEYFKITLDKNWWNLGVYPSDLSIEERQNKQFEWNIVGNKIEKIKHIPKPRSHRERNFVRKIDNLENKYNQTCQEYENTIAELEEIIGTQQRDFLDQVNNLELYVSRCHIEKDLLQEENDELRLLLELPVE